MSTYELSPLIFSGQGEDQSFFSITGSYESSEPIVMQGELSVSGAFEEGEGALLSGSDGTVRSVFRSISQSSEFGLVAPLASYGADADGGAGFVQAAAESTLAPLQETL